MCGRMGLYVCVGWVYLRGGDVCVGGVEMAGCVWDGVRVYKLERVRAM